METIEQKIKKLPQDLQQEVIDFLLTKKVSKKSKKPRLDWIGGLKKYKDKFTALELQKKALNNGVTDVSGKYKYLS